MLDSTITYTLRRRQWQRCRDAFAGEDAIKARGTAYLPALAGQSDEDYRAYRDRAYWFGAFGRTVSVYTGLATRKGIQGEEALIRLDGDVDRNGSTINGFFRELLREVLLVGSVGVLVDHDGERPYLVEYEVETILRHDRDGGRLMRVWLLETVDDWSDWYKETGNMYRLRELALDDNGDYYQQLYTAADLSAAYVPGESPPGSPVGEPIYPLLNGAPLDYIPFFLLPNAESFHAKPPLIDLANLNVAHYRLKADHMHGLHYTALPTPYVTGVDPESEHAPATIGPQVIWLLENENAKPGLLEFTGQGLGAIQAELEALEEKMAVLGARMLASQESEVTATASRIKALGENASLAEIAGMCFDTYVAALQLLADWAGVPAYLSDEMYYDTSFLPSAIEPSTLTALLQGVQRGTITEDVLYFNLEKAEMLPEGFEPEPTADYSPQGLAVLPNLVAAGLMSRETALENLRRAGLIQGDIRTEMAKIEEDDYTI